MEKGILKKETPFGKTVYLESSINERFDRLINEEGHAFYMQYKLSERLARETFSAAILGKNSITVNTSDINPDFKEVEININYVGGTDKTSASFDNLDLKGHYQLTVEINLSDRILPRPQYYEAVKSAIDHELMHGEVFQKKYGYLVKDSGDIPMLDDSPANYEVIISVMRKYDRESYAYQYARALYSTYYQETQALVSQSWPNFRTAMIEDPRSGLPNVSDNDYFRHIMHSMDPYRTFMDNISLCEKLKIYNGGPCDSIVIAFNECGDDSMTREKIMKSLDRIEEKSDYGLRKAVNNAYIYWKKDMDLDDKNFDIWNI